MADALDSGSSESNFMRVQVPSSAPEKKPLLSAKTKAVSFQRNKSLAEFVKFASQVKYACGV